MRTVCLLVAQITDQFVKSEDCELVMHQVYSGVLPKGKRILNDLPQKMKQERYRVEKIAYNFRQCLDKYKTRVVENGVKLELEPSQ